ncbi:MAG: redox-sensing transcriptional repressor Rex [Clostridiales bacterium]|nr:redox-sensing transcriptional repressor Rex [Clostridiales bacterium]
MRKKGKSREKQANVEASLRVSPAVINRLPRYFRYLRELIRIGRLRISSSELSELMNVTASQIRQDLNCFGGFGQQGYGYNVKYLYGKISEILGVTQNYKAIIVGTGNLGRALATNAMFENRGVTLTALFDIDPTIVGKRIGKFEVEHIDKLDEYCTQNQVDIAVITVPRDSAKETAEQLARLGVKGLWNFTNIEFDLSGTRTKVQNVHLGDSLMTLCYNICAEDNRIAAEQRMQSADNQSEQYED